MASPTYKWRLARQVVTIDERPLVMGILNVTPDSFSDGGRFLSTGAAIDHGLRLVEQGADLLDIGGESSRPGAQPVSLEEELRRVVPVVEALAGRVRVPLSVDTTKAEVARACLASGAAIINDITGLRGDPGIVDVVREASAGAVVMHMQGTPQSMQDGPHYEDVIAEIGQFFETRLHELADLGIPLDRVALDPGVGFGKRTAHNFAIIARLGELRRLERPICLGVSRKGFLGAVLAQPLERRLIGSLAAVAYCACRHTAQIARVHDVAETVDLLKALEAIDSHGEAHDSGG
jgi:dihydropteroate synthase